MRKLITIIGLLLCLLASFAGGDTVEAAKSLPPGMVIGDSDGMYATSEGDYYIDLVDILPGEVYEKEITIRSLDLEEPFSLGLLVEKIDSTGSVAWEEHITMTLTLDGEEIYQGPLLGDDSHDWTKTPLELGVCTYGTDKLLTAVFTANSSLTNEDLREKSTLNFNWIFVGTKDQPEEPKPSEPPASTSSERPQLPKAQGTPDPPVSKKRLPQTGEQLVYQFLSGLLLVLIALFLWRKRREEEQE